VVKEMFLAASWVGRTEFAANNIF